MDELKFFKSSILFMREDIGFIVRKISLIDGHLNSLVNKLAIQEYARDTLRMIAYIDGRLNNIEKKLEHIECEKNGERGER